MKDSTSSTSRLVLDLMAPTGTSGQGITLILTADTSKATWATFSSGSYLSGIHYTPLLADKVSVEGSALRIVIAQQPGTAVTYGSTPVLQVALNVASGAAIGNASLTATAGYHLDGTAASSTPITIDAGTLSVK